MCRHGTDWFPHDVKVREAGAPGARTRFETLLLLGSKPASSNPLALPVLPSLPSWTTYATTTTLPRIVVTQ